MQITLRTFVFIDSLQPQLASYLATSSQGFLPVPVEVAIISVMALALVFLARFGVGYLETLSKREGRLTQRWQ